MLTYLKSHHNLDKSSYTNFHYLENLNSGIYGPQPKFFKSEELLVNIFETTIQNNFESKNLYYSREFECSDGIADLIICTLRKDSEKNLSLGNIPPRWAFALFKLPYRKNFTVSDFANLAGITNRSALSRLKIFMDAGYCERKIKKDTWRKIKQPRPIVNNIYAVEAKLRNWKKALSQASRYLDYASQSWVILDENNINPAIKNIKKFQALNIGLASINPRGVLVNHLLPKIHPPRNLLRYWQANAKIAKHINLLNNFGKNCL